LHSDRHRDETLCAAADATDSAHLVSGDSHAAIGVNASGIRASDFPYRGDP
jgi:hypothetical protein